MTDLAKIVDQLSELTVIQAAEISKLLEKKWGVTTVTPVAVTAAPMAVAPVAEKTAFEVFLVSIGDKKIEVIKVTRELTGLGLKEAKELVDAAPKTLKSGVNKEEAENFKNKLELAGAKIELK